MDDVINFCIEFMYIFVEYLVEVVVGIYKDI